MPLTHPTEEILLDVASGESDLPRRVLVEGHLESCPGCRAVVAEMALPGAALLRSLDGEEPPAALWDGLCSRIAASLAEMPPGGEGTDSALPALAPPASAPLAAGIATLLPAAVPPAAGITALPLPGNVRRELAPLRHVRWRWALAPGAWYAELARDPWTESVLLLGYLAPHRFLPAHEHLAQEDVLVLAGGFDDQQGRHELGEYAIYPAGSVHRPATEPGEPCWCLARLERPNRLLGWRGWAQRLANRGRG